MKQLFLVACVGVSLAVGMVSHSTAALTIVPETTSSGLTNSVTGTGITVTGSTLTTAAGLLGDLTVQTGIFSGGFSAGLEIDSGIILTTGSIAEVPGPNVTGTDTPTTSSPVNGLPESTGNQAFFSDVSTQIGGPNVINDSDLDALLGSVNGTHDEAILTINFNLAATSDVFIKFQFGSEEYIDYVGTIPSFNDNFGFFLDGSNVALVPNTQTPVTINTINGTTNPAFYMNNVPNTDGFLVDPTLNSGVSYDGLTTGLVGRGIGLAAGPHTMKFAIADVGDSHLDAGVFIQAGSLSTEVPSDDGQDELPSEAPLSDLLNSGMIGSGDKVFSDFSYHGGGDMPEAEDIFVTSITDADGNFGIRFQGAFVDGVGGGASDALIDFKVTAPEGKLIKDVHLAANPLVIGGDDGFLSITETFLPDNDEIVLTAYDIPGGERKLTDWADLVDENGELAPVQELHVQKDILVWSQEQGSAATMSFIDQTFSQCDDDGNGACVEEVVPVNCDFDGDGDVDAADFAILLASFNTAVMPGTNGDVDGDGDVDGADFFSWQRHCANFPAPIAATTVPEPTALLLLTYGALMMFSRKRRE